MYTVDRNNELVGYSVWPWDDLYPPAVGCYRNGLLEAYAICDLPPQKVRLEGPGQGCWFRLRVDPDTRDALADGDPSVRLMRLEDGVEIPRAGGPAVEGVIRSRHAIDVFRSQVSLTGIALDGFASFLEAPIMHQLDIIFLDILNRLPDPGARQHYGVALDSGMSVLSARKIVMESGEFRERNITVSDRVGALMTSPLWHDLRRAEPLGERRTSLRVIDMTDYAALTSEQFARQIHLDCHGDLPDEATTVRLADASQTLGRSAVVTLLVRDAANGGNFLKVVHG